MLVIIDNYDSFTYNLYQGVMTELQKMGASIPLKVFRNDAITVEQLVALNLTGVILSPGPGLPMNAGICTELVKAIGETVPILGVCLGFQAIVHAFGGDIVRAPQVVHGKTVNIFHRRKGLFSQQPLPLSVGRYHSLIASRETLPSCLTVEADTADGIVMAIQHEHYPCYGVQFHPESYLTPTGPELLRRFLTVAQIHQEARRVGC